MLREGIILCFIITFNRIVQLQEIIGFDCQNKEDLELLSLSNWEDCSRTANTRMDNVEIQLIQKKEFEDIPYYTCNFEITERIIKSKLAQVFTLGFDNNPYTLFTGEQVNQEDCMQAQITRKFRDPVDRSISFNLVQDRAKATKVESYALGNHYFDRSGLEHTNVELKLDATFEISKGKARNIMETNTIIFPNNGQCDYLQTKCRIKGVNYFWKPLNRTLCFQYFVIFEGECIRETNIKNVSEVSYQAISTKTKQQFITFQKEPIEACGKKLFKTENDRIFIAAASDNFIEKDNQFSTLNVDLSILFNMKISTVLSHVSTQTNNLYQEIIYQKCIEDSKSMLNLLTHIGTQGYIPIDRKGNYITSAGEGIKLIKCKIHNLTLYQTNNCYDSFPVNFLDKKAFVSPYTRIITSEAKTIDCGKHPSLLYNKNGTLHSISKGKMTSAKGKYGKFQPNSIKWEFAKLEAVSSKGIYDADLLKKKKIEEISFNTEQGKEFEQNFERRKFEEYEHIIKTFFKKIISIFYDFGTYSASFIGVAVIIQIYKKMTKSMFTKKT